MPGQLLDFDGRPFVFGANGRPGESLFPHDIRFEDTLPPPPVPEVQEIAGPPSIFGIIGSNFFQQIATDPSPPLNLHGWLFPILGNSSGGQAPSDSGGAGFFGGSSGLEFPGGGAADPAPPFNIHDLLSTLFGVPSEPPIDIGIGNSLFG